MNNQPTPITETFAQLGLSDLTLRGLEKLSILTPTPIQHSTIPTALAGQDILGIAQTGTGKTFAFGLPLLERLNLHGGRALILLPTRELAEQVESALRNFASALGIRMAVFIGGASMGRQRAMLRSDPRVLIATPGRLIDHLQQRTVTLKEVSILVLDEADRMLDMGFAPQIKEILKHVPTARQTMLFSATMPMSILDMTKQHMKTPLHVEIAPSGTVAERVEQAILILHKDDKTDVLAQMLSDVEGNALVFVRTKHGASRLTKQLRAHGFSASEIHANRSLNQRREALDGFKSGRYRILVATDIAARGIDVIGIGMVVNYDLPQNPEEYVHRIGRTGRAGLPGQAISFATPDQRDEIRRIERLIRTKLSVAEHPTLRSHPQSFVPTAPRPMRHNQGRSHGWQQHRSPRPHPPHGMQRRRRH